ncbi:MAG: hypothetical protein Q8778_02465, partial [Sweet potato little leaf phytoplasma]|nr:hypothetical protein [Sweet potato little leaf phytoplasma]
EYGYEYNWLKRGKLKHDETLAERDELEIIRTYKTIVRGLAKLLLAHVYVGFTKVVNLFTSKKSLRNLFGPLWFIQLGLVSIFKPTHAFARALFQVFMKILTSKTMKLWNKVY